MKTKLAIIIGLAFCGVIYAQNSLTNGLLAYYPFNGNANDASGNANNGAVYNALLTTDRFGDHNSAYYLNGTNAYISIPNNPVLNLTNDYTLSLWFLQITNQGVMRLVDKATAASNDGWNLDTGFSGDQLLRWVGGVPLTYTFTTTTYTLLNWHQVVITVSAGISTIYLDGVVAGSGSCAINNTNTLDMFIGKAHPGPDPQNSFFNGSVDDLQIYTGALSSNAVQQLYLNQSVPLVNLVKAVAVNFQNLSIGTNYQLQVSSDLNSWTNFGTPFTATNSFMTYSNYWNVSDWNQLFFRLH
jgi:hypothetical protein